MQLNRKIVVPKHGHSSCAPDLVDAAPLPSTPHQSLSAHTPIQTSMGIQRLDALAPGNRVLTRSGIFEVITAVNSVRLSRRQLHDMPHAAPIRFDPGALPGLEDMTDAPAILISPDCLVAWADDASGIDRFPAQAFCDGGLIRWVIPDEGIHYIRLHFDTPQQLCAGGIWVELGEEADLPYEAPLHYPKLVQDVRIFRPLRD